MPRSQPKTADEPSPSFGDGGAAPCQCLIRKAETEKDDAQMRLCYDLGVGSGLIYKRAVEARIVKRKHPFEMRSG